MTETLSPTWSALNAAIQADDHDVVKQQAKALLSVDPDDEVASQCLLIALLQLSDLDEADTVLKQFPKLSSEMTFARAYLLYRQRQFSPSLQLLESLSVADDAVLQLKALLAARLGQMELSARIYRQFLDRGDADHDDDHHRAELLSNYLAVCSPPEAESVLPHLYRLEANFTILYNAACRRIVACDYAGAESLLRRAITLCRKADLTDDELFDELSPIQVQLAYALQMQRMPTEARDLYQSVLETAPSGVHTPAVAVASLNLMSLRHGDEKHFDSAKRLARALKVDARKLTDYQIATIDRNQALLMLFEKQLAACVARTQQLLSADPTCCFPALVMACALVRLKQTDDAYDVLRRQGSLDAHLALVQLQLEQQQNAAALETLHSPVFDDIRLQPGFVSLVCFLQDQDAAVKGLLDAVARNEALAGYAGSYLLRVGKSEEAVDLLSTAIKNAHDDVKLLKSLITSCFAIGREVPVDVINQLPPVPALSAEQIAEYERAALSSSKQLKKKSDAIPESVTTEKKKKKKKKIRYPKGFDPANPGPPPDPERWLPRYERTKGRRRNQMTMKGPQGALPAGIAPAQGSGRSRANRVLEDKNVSDNQRQKVQAASGTSHKSKKGKKRR